MKYISRHSEALLKKYARQFPVVLVTGPRQSGKSTLVKTLFPDLPYVTLDKPDLRALAHKDPEYFLSSYSRPLVIDEIQYAPLLFSYLKVLVDEKRSEMGQFILTGSQSFHLMKGVSESLAGRIGLLTLLPFSWSELSLKSLRDPVPLIREIIQGFYPEVRVRKSLDPAAWYASYIQTYLERDVRNLQFVKDLNLFQRFVTLLAARVGSLLNVSELARDAGISQGAANQWLSILEASHLIYRLPPYFRNKGKRLIKSSKIYFEDTGLLCHLLHETSVEALLAKPLSGFLFENLVISDLRKESFSRGEAPHFYFYRTSAGDEVDLVIEEKGGILPLEIKLGKSLRPDQFKPLERFCALFKTQGKWISLSSEKLGTGSLIQTDSFPFTRPGP